MKSNVFLFNKSKILFLTLMLIFIAFRYFSTGSANIAYVLIAGYSLVGRPQIIQSLFLSWLFTMANLGVFPDASFSGIGRYLVLFSCAISIFWHNGFFSGKLKRITFLTIIVGGAIFVHSCIVSPIADVSLLKSFSWLLTVTTLIAAWSSMTEKEHKQTELFVFGGLLCIGLVSLLLIGTSVGALRNGTGFQGVLNHPQVFGPAMSILGVWALSKSFSQKESGWSLILIAVLSLMYIVMSESRTAGISILISLSFSFLMAIFIKGKKLYSIAPGFYSYRIWVLLGILTLSSLVFAEKISSKFDDFVSKSGRADVASINAAYDNSRGNHIAKMLNNIKLNPLHGIGFGLASSPNEMVVKRDSFLGLPVGAAVEKGAAPIAIIEEIGIPLSILVYIWFFKLLLSSFRNRIEFLSVFLTVFLLNMGEATLFSPGGQGMLMLIVFTWAGASVNRSKLNND